MCAYPRAQHRRRRACAALHGANKKTALVAHPARSPALGAVWRASGLTRPSARAVLGTWRRCVLTSPRGAPWQRADRTAVCLVAPPFRLSARAPCHTRPSPADASHIRTHTQPLATRAPPAPQRVGPAASVVRRRCAARRAGLRARRGLGGEDEADDEAVQAERLGEDEDEHHADVQLRLLRRRAHASVAHDANGLHAQHNRAQSQVRDAPRRGASARARVRACARRRACALRRVGGAAVRARGVARTMPAAMPERPHARPAARCA